MIGERFSFYRKGIGLLSSHPGLGRRVMGKGSLRQGTLVLSIQLAAPVSGQAVLALISTGLNVLVCEMRPMPFTSVVTADEGNIHESCGSC